VVLYILVGGYRPFRGTGTEIMRQIRYGDYQFHDQIWSNMSNEAKDLIRRMLTVDPRKRITASEALESDWIIANDMFSANEKILGRKIATDGNPHLFVEKVFDCIEPYPAAIMNNDIIKLAPATEQSKLQPALFQEEGADDSQEGLQPFFPDDGEFPWDEVISRAFSMESMLKRRMSGEAKKKVEASSPEEEAGQVLLKISQKKSHSDTPNLASLEGIDASFMTDKEITGCSQHAKSPESAEKVNSTQQVCATRIQEAVSPLQQWAQNLPRIPATETFGDFHFDIDAIMTAMNKATSQSGIQ